MQKENQLTIYFSVVIASAILITSQIILFNKGFYSISADEAGRTLDAFYFFNGETGLYSIWLPFQKLLYSAGLYFYFDLIWTPRLLSVFFGIATLISLMYLHYELFRNSTAAVFTVLLSSMYFGIVIFGVLPLSEIYFFFFTVLSIAFIIGWLRTDKSIYLWSTLVLSFINNTTRYEAWIFSFALLVIIILNLYRNKNNKKILISFLCIIVLASFPIYWIYSAYKLTGETVSFINSVSERYRPGSYFEELRVSVLYSFFNINLMTLNLLGFITVLLYYKSERIIRIYINIFASTLVTVSVILFTTEAMPTHNSWRLALIWSILLIPFTAHWLYQLFSSENKMMKYSFGIVMILLIYFFNIQTFNMSQVSYLTKEDYNIGKIFESGIENQAYENKILIAHNGWRYSGILLASQHPNNFITDKEIEEKYGIAFSTNDRAWLSRLRQNNIEFLLLESASDVDPVLEVVREFDYWTLYKLPVTAAASTKEGN